MGYMTVVCILNDAWETLKANKEEFMRRIEEGMYGENSWDPRRSINSYGVGNHYNPMSVTRSFHADIRNLYIVGGNCMTDLTNTNGLNDHDIAYLIESQRRAKELLEFGETNVCDYVVKQILPKVTKEMNDDEILGLINDNELVKSQKKYFGKKKICYIQKELIRKRK